MKALIYKDLRAYKFFYMAFMVVMLLYSYLNIQFGSVEGIIGFLLILVPSAAGMILFLGDGELLALIATMPTARKEIVFAKYLSTYLISGVLIAFTYVIIWFLSRSYPGARQDLSLLLSLRGILFAVMPITFIVSICYPLLFRYGFSLGVRILLGGFALSYGLGMVIMENVIGSKLKVPRRGVFQAAMSFFQYLENLVNKYLLYSGIILLLFLLLFGSVRISRIWYEKKDL